MLKIKKILILIIIPYITGSEGIACFPRDRFGKKGVSGITYS
jgi:hypothetical protein